MTEREKMREIIFRGKTLSGAWKYGYFLKSVNFDEDDIAVITDNKIPEYVLKNTIGQYTGLCANGTKIFEGDIVRLIDKFVDFRTYAVIEFGNPNGLYNWGWQLRPLENKPFAVEILHWVDMEESGAYIEVIGNIHDNPELLKGVRE